MHVGQPHGDGLPQTEAPPRTHADEFLTVRIVLEPVVAERREPHHALDGHLVELHEKAELRHPGNDAGECLAGALPQQEAPETAGDFPFGLGLGNPYSFWIVMGAAILSVVLFSFFWSARKQ